MGRPSRGPYDYWAPGDWNALCWRCGFKYKASMLLKHWQGFFVCRNCWEPRQPQDFVQGTYDVQIPPWTQPPPKDIFVGSANLTTENDLDLLVDPDNGVFTEAITN